jgi:uncharacterized SAM-binding protein YcdF (DUF218 family)
MRERIRTKRRLFAFILLGAVFALTGLFYQPILIWMGGYLAPESPGKADVVILEGTELIRENAVEAGVKLLSSGEARRLVVVYQHSNDERIFGRPLNYGLYLTKELGELGLGKDQIIILVVPKEHPITLTEAQIVLSNLSRKGIKSAILVSEGFHTRRSFWTYRQVGSGLGIDIFPHPYFMKNENKIWWQKMDGIRDFVEEGMKFFYYLIRGYIPIKSLVTTY